VKTMLRHYTVEELGEVAAAQLCRTVTEMTEPKTRPPRRTVGLLTIVEQRKVAREGLQRYHDHLVTTGRDELADMLAERLAS
jgi:hypothetical protein